MKKYGIDRRKYIRYDTDMKLYFHVKYDINTRVKFKVLKGAGTHKYSGLCRNVSVEGMCFVSKKKLEKGDVLLLEVYEPIVKGPVVMEAEVRWCRQIPEEDKRKGLYHTGIRILLVNGNPVAGSICIDRKYKVAWSNVLDSLFGNFAAMIRKLKERRRHKRAAPEK